MKYKYLEYRKFPHFFLFRISLLYLPEKFVSVGGRNIVIHVVAFPIIRVREPGPDGLVYEYDVRDLQINQLNVGDDAAKVTAWEEIKFLLPLSKHIHALSESVCLELNSCSRT